MMYLSTCFRFTSAAHEAKYSKRSTANLLLKFILVFRAANDQTPHTITKKLLIIYLLSNKYTMQMFYVSTNLIKHFFFGSKAWEVVHIKKALRQVKVNKNTIRPLLLMQKGFT